MRLPVFLKISVMILSIFYSMTSIAQSTETPIQLAELKQSPVKKRAQAEKKLPPNYFSINLYKPNYVLPYYFTGSPYSSIYKDNVAGNQSIKSSEVKYQLSFKVPIWRNINSSFSSLYFAYSQLSYWQLYNHNPFFRESDYEPELYLANEINLHLYKDWHINFVNIGADHQSNGFGGTLERSWNRIYVEAISSTGNWMVSVKPWYVFHDSTYNRQNPNLAHYLGYGQILVGYKYGNQVFSLLARNVIGSGAKRAGAELAWSFPITPYIKGYVQAFSGYGQSLIEYNHHTNSIGVGVALNDWV